MSPNKDNRQFIAFLVSDERQNIMVNHNHSTHFETGNIFYQNFNKTENFYSFLIAQQDGKKAIIPKRFSYHFSFEKFINKYLPLFSIDDAEEFDLFANKNSKYLFYKFNDQIKALGGGKRIIRHTAKMKDSISLKKIEERDRQFLVEKKFTVLSSATRTKIQQKKNRLLKLLKVIIKHTGEFSRVFLLILLTVLLYTFIP